jgi:2-methylisocitrate lyase-like PEP mutase family enzyme
MRRIGDSFDLPLVANMVERGRTPLLTRPQLEALGFRLAIFPTAGFLAATAAMERAYSVIRDTGSSLPVIDQLYDFGDFNKLIGFEDVWAFDQAHAD